VGGYNLDEFVPGAARQGRLQPLALVCRLGRDARCDVEARLKLSSCPRQGRAGRPVCRLLEALQRPPDIAPRAARSSGGSIRARFHATESEANRLRDFSKATRAILLVEFYGGQATSCPAAGRPGAELRQRGFGYHYTSSPISPPGTRLEAPQDGAGLSMARRVMPRRSRSSRIRPLRRSTCAITSRNSWRSFLVMDRAASTRTPRLAACTCDRGQPQTEEGVRNSRRLPVMSRAGAQVRWCLSGEHGDGLVRSPFQEKMYGTILYQAFRELKRRRPHNLLNPGKIVDAPPLTANCAMDRAT